MDEIYQKKYLKYKAKLRNLLLAHGGDPEEVKKIKEQVSDSESDKTNKSLQAPKQEVPKSNLSSNIQTAMMAVISEKQPNSPISEISEVNNRTIQSIPSNSPVGTNVPVISAPISVPASNEPLSPVSPVENNIDRTLDDIKKMEDKNLVPSGNINLN